MCHKNKHHNKDVNMQVAPHLDTGDTAFLLPPKEQSGQYCYYPTFTVENCGRAGERMKAAKSQ